MRFRKRLATINPAPERTQRATAPGSVIWPVAKWRAAVRGFKASNLRSTIRLKTMAQVRPQTMAARINPNLRHPGQPRFSRAATAMAARAKGKAKRVCEKRMNEAHLRIVENIVSFLLFLPSGEQTVVDAQMIENPGYNRIHQF